MSTLLPTMRTAFTLLFIYLCFVFVTEGDELITKNVGLPSDSKLMAFGDFNSDKKTDLFFVKDKYTLQVYLWSGGQFATTDDLTFTHSLEITNIVPGDFNHDGKMDVLISGPAEEAGAVYLHLHKGSYDALSADFTELPKATDQVLVMDFNNDLHLDLYGVSFESGQRTAWVNKGGFEYELKEVYLPGQAYKKLASPHSNAFVDMDGDCLSDLFLSTHDPETDSLQLELWLNRKSEGYVLDKVWKTPRGMGQMTFMDFNADGTIDVMFPTCYPSDTCAEDNSIHVFFNVQKPMCGAFEVSDSCRSQQNLCSVDPNFALANMTDLAPSPTHTVLDKTKFGSARFPPFSENIVTIRAGDLNLDGSPDILVPLIEPSTTSGKGARVASLWLGSDCTYGACFPTFNRITNENDLNNVKNVHNAAFFDIGDKGSLDIFVLSDTEGDGDSSLHSTKALGNQYEQDAYFMTTLGSNGVCPSWCDSSPKFPDPKPYGVNMPGVSVKLTVTDLGGQKYPRQGAQLPQSAYNALHTPYNLYGLGRTSNYIEELYFGFPLKYEQHYQMWVAMIPNSQLICFPHPASDPEDWTLELFLSPSESLIWVIVAIISTLFVNALVIMYFHMQELKEDAAEKQSTEHLFAF